MKKLFGRDKGKGKIAPSDIGSGLPMEVRWELRPRHAGLMDVW